MNDTLTRLGKGDGFQVASMRHDVVPPNTAAASAADHGGGGERREAADILDERVGYALHYDVTGGTTLYHVTNSNDSGAGSLRAGAEAGGRWIVFDADVDITLLTPVAMAANTTVDGRDTDGNPKSVTVRGKSIQQINTPNVIYENLTLRDISSFDDGLQIRGATSTFWVHHCTVGDPTDNVNDGLIDVTDNAKGTVSYCRLNSESDQGADRAMLIGNNQSGEDESNEDGCFVTVHRCWFNDTRTRNPGVFGGRAHIVECLVENWSLYGVGVHGGGQALIQGSVFRKASSGNADKAYGQASDYGTRRVKAEGNWHLGFSSGIEADPEEVFTPPYTLACPTITSDAEADARAELLRTSTGARVVFRPQHSPAQRTVLAAETDGAETVNTPGASAELSVTFSDTGAGGASTIPRGTGLIFFIYARGTARTTVTPPDGARLVRTLQAYRSSVNTVAVYAKVAGEDEPSTQTATVRTNSDSASAFVTGMMVAIAVEGIPADTGRSTLDAAGDVVVNAVSSADIVAPSVTVADDLSLLLGFYTNVVSDRTVSSAQFDEEVADVNAASLGLTAVDGTLAVYRQEVGAGATGPRTATVSLASTTNHRGMLLALKPMRVAANAPVVRARGVSLVGVPA